MFAKCNKVWYHNKHLGGNMTKDEKEEFDRTQQLYTSKKLVFALYPAQAQHIADLRTVVAFKDAYSMAEMYYEQMQIELYSNDDSSNALKRLRDFATTYDEQKARADALRPDATKIMDSHSVNLGYSRWNIDNLNEILAEIKSSPMFDDINVEQLTAICSFSPIGAFTLENLNDLGKQGIGNTGKNNTAVLLEKVASLLSKLATSTEQAYQSSFEYPEDLLKFLMLENTVSSAAHGLFLYNEAIMNLDGNVNVSQLSDIGFAEEVVATSISLGEKILEGKDIFQTRKYTEGTSDEDIYSIIPEVEADADFFLEKSSGVLH